MQGVFTFELVVPASAIDANRHVNNLEYLRWMQQVALQHSAAQGWDFKRYMQAGSSWVVRSHFIEYVRPAFVDQRLCVATWVAGFAEQSSPRRYLFWRPDDEKVIARAESLWVHVDGTSGRPADIPSVLREAFSVVSKDEEAIVAFLQQQH